MQAIKKAAMETRRLREFGLLLGGMIAMAFGLLIPWIWDLRLPLWPWIAAVVLALWALLAPNSLAPVYRGWMRFGGVLGRFNTGLLLGLVFFLVMAPVGLLMRTLRRDPLCRDWEAGAQTYRTTSKQPNDDNLGKPF